MLHYFHLDKINALTQKLNYIKGIYFPSEDVCLEKKIGLAYGRIHRRVNSGSSVKSHERLKFQMALHTQTIFLFLFLNYRRFYSQKRHAHEHA